MANQEHLDLFKQGIEMWNQWRQKNPETQPDLSYADLRFANLSGAELRGEEKRIVAKGEGANLCGADLRFANFSRANLSRSEFISADLSSANFNRANLCITDLTNADLTNANFAGADLSSANFSMANLTVAIFGFANLSWANFEQADLTGADLRSTDLTLASFSMAKLNCADFTQATLGSTTFANVDLRGAEGLGTVEHQGPSSIGIDTIYRSQGQIPEIFLRQAGVPASFLEVMAAITNRPIEYYTVFISYSSKNQDFAERLYADLQSKGVRCWFAPEHMKIGDKIRHRIDESIRLYDKLLLVLSEHSVSSLWIEREVETAFEKERQKHKEVLFPIRVDETVMQTTEAWAADIRRTRHIGDFTKWKHHDDYQQALERLLRDLQAGI